MNKKLLFTLLIVGTTAISYSLFRETKSFEEQEAVDENAKIAVDFSKYICDFRKKTSRQEFYRRFIGVPPECQEEVWATLNTIDTLPAEPSSVTVPAMGKAKRYVYYDLGDKKYCFTVSLIKKRWYFKGLREIKE